MLQKPTPMTPIRSIFEVIQENIDIQITKKKQLAKSEEAGQRGDNERSVDSRAATRHASQVARFHVGQRRLQGSLQRHRRHHRVRELFRGQMSSL